MAQHSKSCRDALALHEHQNAHKKTRTHRSCISIAFTAPHILLVSPRKQLCHAAIPEEKGMPAWVALMVPLKSGAKPFTPV